MNLTKTINTDVLIIGGGLAGCAAALASARKGVKTTLIEASGVLGGQAGFGLVTPIGSIQTNNTNISFGGIVEELCDEITVTAEKYCVNNPNEGEHWPLASSHIIKYVLLKKLIETNVDIRFHTSLFEAVTENDKITHTTVFDKSGLYNIYAKVFIDASGDADLTVMSGAEYVCGSEDGVFSSVIENNENNSRFPSAQNAKYDQSGLMQPVSLFFIMGGVDYERASALNNKKLHFGDLGITKEKFMSWKFAGSCGFEITDDKIPTPQGRVLVTRGPKNDMAVVNMSRIIGIDGSDAESLNEGEIKAQLQLIPIIDFLQTFIPGFENSYYIQSATSLGIRETRRLKGKYILSGNEVINCARHTDAIARGSYIIDIHDPNGKNSAIGGEIKGDFYDIPYGCLISGKVKNLLVCGRCISADHVAHSSSRIQGTCIMTGQAAGTASAMSISEDILPFDLNGEKLREKLISDGVYLD